MSGRELTGHRVNPVNDRLIVKAIDEPGPGGANHSYEITGFDERCAFPGGKIMVWFQNGTIPEKGVNGLTQEVLLEIVADRLRSFQSGPFACHENQMALERVEEAMHWLHSRTLKRMRRGVEGTHTA